MDNVGKVSKKSKSVAVVAVAVDTEWTDSYGPV